jgi:hypothetical protein
MPHREATPAAAQSRAAVAPKLESSRAGQPVPAPRPAAAPFPQSQTARNGVRQEQKNDAAGHDIHVRIGRVEIRAAQAPARQSIAAPRPQTGFADLLAARTYLDRTGR